MPLTDSSRRRRLRVILLGLVAVAVTLGVVFAVPIPHDYSFSFPPVPVCGPSTQTESYPAGAQVRGSWQSVSGANVVFELRAPSGPVIYDANGTSGSYSFGATSGSYVLEATPTVASGVGCKIAPPVTVTGTWTATIAQLVGA